MVFNNNSGLEGKMNQKIGWKPILLTLTISIMLFSCNLEDTGQENSSTIQDKIAPQKNITLSLRLTGKGLGRSTSKTSLGTFRDISKIKVNAKRKNRLSLIYPDPGLELFNAGDEWKGTLTGLIVGESYTFFISALNSDETEIFRGETDHQVVSGNNAISITLYPVLNNLVVAVPVIRQIIISETIAENETTSVVASVEMNDNSSIDWNFMPYTNQNGFAISCQAESCGSFSPSSGTTSPNTADNMTVSDSLYNYILESDYTSPANNTTQLLRLQVTNEAGIGAETRFSIKVVGDVSSALQFQAAPSVLKMTVARVQDNVICPDLDCLAFEAFVDDDKPFSELQAEWNYTTQSSKIFGGLDNLTHSDPKQGYFRSVMSGYKDSDSGQVILKIRDSDGLIGQINFPLFPDAYPLTRLCLSAGQCSVATFGSSILGEAYFSTTP